MSKLTYDEAAALEATENLSFGRAIITPKLKLVADVTGGGAHGPGRVSRYVDYDRTVGQGWIEDRRSGSKRSGSCIWQLEADQLYYLSGIADGSRSNANYAISTIGGIAKTMTRAELDAERARIWPMGKQLADEAAERQRQDEAARIQRDAERAEARRIELEALAELNAEKAAEIAEKGQEKVEGLPELKGTPKQIAYALNIRKAFAEKHPGDPALKRGTTAKYWIENHKGALYGR